ncbi:hypothetical protein MNAN1_000264 [Malassezia nana]|uniref:Dynein heavy chain, cytoplasmic n=1 Tax=Malassezia nana TaxID=180528 RepID=A0AAF0EIP5_9BASI|nr:hypothetical protein MNAN1_000264 [Malassezia nana]
MAEGLTDPDPAGDWSADACRTVARELTLSLDLGEHREAIVDTIVWIHFGASDLGHRMRAWTERQYHPSPQHLLALLASFRAIIREQREQLEDQQRFRLVGLDKLHDTVEQVEKLQSSLSTKQERLHMANEKANDRLQRMVEQQQAAEHKRESSLAFQAELQAQESAVAQQHEMVLQELAEAEPAVLDAQAAVSNIKKQHLSEVRSMTNPPAPVKLTMESVCILLGHHIDGWKSVQSLIRRDDFIASVVHLDTASAVPRALCERLQREYLQRPEYNYETIHRASTACGPLARWVLAQVHFADILERVAPLRSQVDTLEAQAAATKAQAAEAEATLAALEESIASYKREYAALISETQSLTNEMELVQARVARSVRLLDGLSAERTRWERGREAFDAQVRTVMGDALLCSAMIAYAGFFDQARREMLWRSWHARLVECNVPVRMPLSMVESLASADERAAWHAMGLPPDLLSTENAVMLQRCTRVPLLIDPSGRATSFVQALYADAQPATASFLDGSFVQLLERALRFGTPLILTDAEHWDPILLPILSGERRRTGGRTLVRVGTMDVDWAPTFRLVLTTRHAGLVLPASVFARVQVINFTMTPKSLQAQVLAQVLETERPDVAAQRRDLQALQSEYERRLWRLEQSLLAALNEAEGRLLDDERVVGTLESLKAEADDVTAKMQSAAALMQSVEDGLQAYTPLAEVLSAAYFLLERLRVLHPFYAFDMPFFQRVLHDVLAMPRGTGDERQAQLHQRFFVTLYERAAPSLLQADRLVWALALAQIYCRTGPCAGALDGADATALLAGGTTPTTERLAHARRTDPAAWAAWDAHAAPEAAPLPLAPLSGTDETLRRALAVRDGRPDRLEAALKRLVHELFGEPLLDRPLVPLRELAHQTPSATPLALCSVAGYDASMRAEACAAAAGVACAQVALGAPEALMQADAALAAAARSGTWILIKNGHLAPAWLATLPTRLAALAPAPLCRVWITCELSPAVPAALVQAAHVVMHEPPAGFKAALLEALETLETREAPPSVPERERLYFLVAVLHAMVLERVRHTPLGWSHVYEFYDTDLDAAFGLVDVCIAEAAGARAHVDPEDMPWDALRALLAQAVYGCKMDSAADRAMLDALLAHLFTPAAFEHDFCLAPHATHPCIAPDSVHREAFVQWAQQLPEPQPVHWLLLAPAAERVTAAERAHRVLQRLGHLQASAQRDDETYSMAPPAPDGPHALSASWVDELLALLPDAPSAALAPSADSDAAPLARFWAREQAMACAVLERVRSDLQLVADLLTQRTPRTAELGALHDTLAQDQVPFVWQQHNVPRGATLRAWLADLRACAEHAWKASEPIELGRLWAAPAFLTATRQCVARHTDASLEQLHLHLRLGSARASPVEWRIGALWLDGATLDPALALNDGAPTCVAESGWTWAVEAPTHDAQHVSLPLFLDRERQAPLLHASVPLAPGASAALATLRAVALRVR